MVISGISGENSIWKQIRRRSHRVKTAANYKNLKRRLHVSGCVHSRVTEGRRLDGESENTLTESCSKQRLNDTKIIHVCKTQSHSWKITISSYF